MLQFHFKISLIYYVQTYKHVSNMQIAEDLFSANATIIPA